MTTSVGIMVGSFRQTVQVWMNNQLKADLFVRPATNPSADRHPTIECRTCRQDCSPARSRGSRPLSRIRNQLPGTACACWVPRDTIGRSRSGQSRVLLRTLRPSVVNAELRSGDNALISEPFANKHHLQPGRLPLRLPLAGTQVRFRIIDVFYDYGSEKGFIVIDRSRALRYLHDPAISNWRSMLRRE